jgi:hypothetical protein
MPSTIKKPPKKTFPSSDSSLHQIRRIFTKHINILCIEDNPQICSILCDFFRSPILNKKSVHTFDSARSAILSKTYYHFWILDLTLKRPNDGMDLLKLKQGFPFCIVVSGAKSMSTATDAIKAGAYGAYDKNEIFLSNPHNFIREVCALSTLSLLMNAIVRERFDMFDLLIKKFIQTPEEWSHQYCRNERTIRDMCEEYSGLTAKQFLIFFHAINSILLSDCIVMGLNGHDQIMDDLLKREVFYERCCQYVLMHLEDVYGSRYLKTTTLLSLPPPAFNAPIKQNSLAGILF